MLMYPKADVCNRPVLAASSLGDPAPSLPKRLFVPSLSAFDRRACWTDKRASMAAITAREVAMVACGARMAKVSVKRDGSTVVDGDRAVVRHASRER